MISTPALAFHLPETEYDWGYETTMVDSHGYRRVEKHNTRGGKVLGGSSALNYFSWMRGSKGIYDEWAEYPGGGGRIGHLRSAGRSSKRYVVCSICVD